MEKFLVFGHHPTSILPRCRVVKVLQGEPTLFKIMARDGCQEVLVGRAIESVFHKEINGLQVCVRNMFGDLFCFSPALSILSWSAKTALR